MSDARPALEPQSHNVDDRLESTLQLLDRARKGDGEAVERLVARHLAPLRRWARGRLPRWARDLSDTDDLVQDTLLQTMGRLAGFEPRGPGALQAYLRQAIRQSSPRRGAEEGATAGPDRRRRTRARGRSLAARRGNWPRSRRTLRAGA